MALFKQNGGRLTVYALRKLYRQNKVSFKFLNFRHRWRRPDDMIRKNKDNLAFIELQEGVKDAYNNDREICFIDEAIFNGRQMPR